MALLLCSKTAYDFASSSGCEQMVMKHTHIGCIFVLVLTDVPDLVGVRVGLSGPQIIVLFSYMLWWGNLFLT